MQAVQSIKQRAVQSIKQRTDRKLQQNLDILQHQWIYQYKAKKQIYTVLPGVFSPAIFVGTQWLTNQILKCIKAQDKFLQIGVGCGVTSIQLAKQHSNIQIFCCDINPQAVNNTKLNAQKYKVQIEVRESNMFEKIKQRDFDVIYWNFPFHKVEFETETMLQKAIRDPGYRILESFLCSAREHLKIQGYLLLGFSEKMGDMGCLKTLAQKYKWNAKIISTFQDDPPLISLLQLTQCFQPFTQ